jgi:hypothetical protein
MRHNARERSRWLTVAGFATAMAWMEAATVYYLRTMTDRIEPYQANPLPIQGALGQVELVREAATLLMLLTVGMVSARSWPRRLGYSAIAFGVWDILYYVFLRVMTGWPASLLDWDILFLLPLPWWGPVLAPVAIAVLLIAWGTLATQFTDSLRANSIPWTWWGAGTLGTGLALYVFMSDALGAAHLGTEAVRNVLPAAFNWPLFLLALALMAAPVIRSGWRIRPPRRPVAAITPAA